MARKTLDGPQAFGPAAGVKRSVRVAARVREEIAAAIGHELRDPRVAHAVVTRVEMTDDLQIATVRVRTLEGGDTPEARKRMVAGLSAASGTLRKRLGQNLGLRRTPELRFFYDEGVDASDRVTALLHEIERERQR